MIRVALGQSKMTSLNNKTVGIFRTPYLASNASRFVMRMTRHSIKPLKTNAIAIFGTHIETKRAELVDCFLTIAVQVMNDR